MNNIHEELWTAFNDISFEESTHSYTDSLGTVYQSATGWIKRFYPDKNWEAIRAASAAKAIKKEKGSGYEPTEKELAEVSATLKAKWGKSGDYACNLGTQIHSVMENLWYKKDYHFDSRLDEEFPEMRADFDYRKMRCIELFKKMKRIYAPVANEFIVYDQPHGICGTIDFLAYNMKTGKYAIIDWKTSKKFEVGNNFNEYLKAPFNDVESCNTAEYSLQLSLYKYMLEKHTSIRIDEMLLFQIPGKESAMPQVFRCYDFSDRIAKLLQ